MMESLHYLLMKSHACLSRRICARAQQEIGLSPGQPKVLDFLAEHEGCDQKTIAASCEIEQAPIGSILLRMEEKGLIERRRRQGNRRSLFVYLTDSGRKAAEEMQKIFSEEDEAAFAALNHDERRKLTELLTLLCSGVEREWNKEGE